MIKKIINYLKRYSFKIVKISTNNPISNKPLGNDNDYKKLIEGVENETYNYIDSFEKKCGFSINKQWINNIALKTQISIKNSKPNYQHGRILYSLLRKFIDEINDKKIQVTVLETGTAIGFSALCMAKAFEDSDFKNYKILTLDIIPSKVKIFWNKFGDEKGKRSREEILKDWHELQNNIIFLSGDTKNILQNLFVSRINFAFLDAVHNKINVQREFKFVSERQQVGDLIVFDDITKNQFPELTEYLQNIGNKSDYKIEYLNSTHNRGYAIAKKVK